MSLGAQCQWERGQACSCSVGFSYKFVFYFRSSPLPRQCCSEDVACLIFTAVQSIPEAPSYLDPFLSDSEVDTSQRTQPGRAAHAP